MRLGWTREGWMTSNTNLRLGFPEPKSNSRSRVCELIFPDRGAWPHRRDPSPTTNPTKPQAQTNLLIVRVSSHRSRLPTQPGTKGGRHPAHMPPTGPPKNPPRRRWVRAVMSRSGPRRSQPGPCPSTPFRKGAAACPDPDPSGIGEFLRRGR